MNKEKETFAKDYKPFILPPELKNHKTKRNRLQVFFLALIALFVIWGLGRLIEFVFVLILTAIKWIL